MNYFKQDINTMPFAGEVRKVCSKRGKVTYGSSIEEKIDNHIFNIRILLEDSIKHEDSTIFYRASMCPKVRAKLRKYLQSLDYIVFVNTCHDNIRDFSISWGS